MAGGRRRRQRQMRRQMQMQRGMMGGTGSRGYAPADLGTVEVQMAAGRGD